MYQGGLCCLLITIMTLCAANQASGPDTELTKHDNILLDQHTAIYQRKKDSKEKEFVLSTTPSSVEEQQESIEFSTIIWDSIMSSIVTSNADISTVTSTLISSTSTKNENKQVTTTQTLIQASPDGIELTKPITTVTSRITNSMNPSSTVTLIPLVETSSIKNIVSSQTNNRQRISAVKVTLPPGGVIKGIMKNSKIPPGLNYVFDAHPNINKHHHHDYRYGPHFETGNVTNITVQAGNTFYLNCRISLLQDKTVSWVHRRLGQTALQLLTVGKQTYSGDARFTIDFQYPNNWRLKIESVIKDDEGVYECQVSTHPPRIITYHLNVNDPKILIVDEAGIPLLDKYVQVDSTIKLACIVRHISMTSSVVYWLHGDTILNYDLTRGGISVKTDLKDFGANSTLFVAKVNKSDSGNYTCSIGPHQYYTVTVHVLNESLAELHHSSSSNSLYSINLWKYFPRQILLTALLAIVFHFSLTPSLATALSLVTTSTIKTSTTAMLKETHRDPVR